MNRKTLYWIAIGIAAVALVAFNAPSWLALLTGLAIALASRFERPKQAKLVTTLALQLGVMALGAGMNLDVILRVGVDGALVTATGLALAVMGGLALGRWLGVSRDTSLLVAVGTGICGGSAIAAVASVIKPKDHEISIALAIHDTSSVVGAGLVYGQVALTVATTTKLARALWIVPVTIATAVLRRSQDPEAAGKLRDVKWPWFILGFVAVAALVTWVPALAPYAKPTTEVGRRSLVLALFLIGLSLSPTALAKVGPKPFVLGVILWVVIAIISLPLAMLST